MKRQAKRPRSNTPWINAKDYPSKDAEEDIWVRVMPIDALQGDPRSPTTCAAALAGCRQHHFVEFAVYRMFAYALLPGDTTYTRFRNGPTVVKMLSDYDINRAHAERRIPVEGVNVVFRVPSYSESLGYQRSARRKQSNAEANHKLRRKKKAKKKTRVYKLPDPLTLSGVRWGPKKRDK